MWGLTRTTFCTTTWAQSRAVNWVSRVQAGLAGPSPLQRTRQSTVLKLRSPSNGLASPRVPLSPRKAAPWVQKFGLLPALAQRQLMGHQPLLCTMHLLPESPFSVVGVKSADRHAHRWTGPILLPRPLMWEVKIRQSKMV